MPREVPPPQSRLHPRTELRRIEAYQESGSDGEAARALGLPHNTFSFWRMRRGLPAKHPRPGQAVLSRAEQKRRRDAYRRHGTDAEAADELSMPRTAFRAWRNLNGLPAKCSRPDRIDEAEDRRRRATYQSSESDEEAAALLGIGIGGYKWWRQQRGLPGKGVGGPTVTSTEQERRLRAYHETANDIEAATILRLTQSGFQRWRAKAGLPAKTANKGQHVTPREQARRFRAYRTGGTDAEIAKRLDLKLATYRGWRQAEGLPVWRRPLRLAAASG